MFTVYLTVERMAVVVTESNVFLMSIGIEHAL